MPEVREIAEKVRSKNAGPFWVTIDIFCGSDAAFRQLVDGLSTERVAVALGAGVESLQRFDIAELAVIKISLPRPVVQGHRGDRDMHGAALASIVGELVIN